MVRRIPLNGTAWKRNASVHALGAVGLRLGGLALQQELCFALHPGVVAGISVTPAAARQDDYARIDAAAYDPAFWHDHPVLARTPTDRAAITPFERTGAFGRLTDMLE